MGAWPQQWVVPAPTLAPSRTQGDLLREREMWVDKGGVLLRENKTKVVTTIGNYLEGSGKADGELTNPCACMTCMQYASLCHNGDTPLWFIFSTPTCIHTSFNGFIVLLYHK